MFRKIQTLFDFYPTCLEKKQTRWYIYTWVLFSTHVWILTHMFGKRHTCVTKTTQLYVCKCWAFSTHVWEKPLTCIDCWLLSLAHQKPRSASLLKRVKFLPCGCKNRRSELFAGFKTSKSSLSLLQSNANHHHTKFDSISPGVG